jgi:hypothetical protein
MTDDSHRKAAELDEELAALCAHIEAATHRQLELIAELETRGIWTDHGATSYAAWLSWRIGLAPGVAREKIRVARALRQLPAIDEQFRAAKISYSKVRALTRVAHAGNEEVLLDYALQTTAAHLETICRGLRRVERDAEGRIVEAAPERWVRERLGDGGMVRLEAQLHPDEAALLSKAIDLARGLGGSGVVIDRADALVRIAEAFLSGEAGSRSGGDRAQIVVHVSADVPAGTPAPVLLDDGTRVPAETFRRVACDATIAPVMVDDAGRVVEAGRKTRVVAGATRRALLARDRHCRFPGCDHRAWLDAHHVEHWAHGGATTLANLVALCPAHHRLVHEGGFSVERIDGEPVFRSPDGAQIPRVPTVPAGRLEWLLRHVPAGTSFDESTLLPSWDGRPPDVEACMAAALRSRAPRAARDRDTEAQQLHPR